MKTLLNLGLLLGMFYGAYWMSTSIEESAAIQARTSRRAVAALINQNIRLSNELKQIQNERDHEMFERVYLGKTK